MQARAGFLAQCLLCILTTTIHTSARGLSTAHRTTSHHPACKRPNSTQHTAVTTARGARACMHAGTRVRPLLGLPAAGMQACRSAQMQKDMRRNETASYQPHPRPPPADGARVRACMRTAQSHSHLQDRPLLTALCTPPARAGSGAAAAAAPTKAAAAAERARARTHGRNACAPCAPGVSGARHWRCCC